MVFNSISFFAFFPVVTLTYFAVPYARRWLILFLASCYFYMALIPKYIGILFLLILIDYYAGLLIEKSEGRSRKTYLALSIVANIGILFVFKYFNFISANLGEIFSRFGLNYDVPRLSLILPIGLSFHTFQSLSYTFEVYKGRQKAETSLKTYALYVLFFPQLVAGPIERPQNLLHQFNEHHDFAPERVVSGLRLMLIGFFKKVVVADGLSLYVDAVYNHPQGFNGAPLIIATIFFAFEIYCDFSGYTDIARGAARVLGFHLIENFRRPYLASSVTEFWHRWHISLSTWFRDYVYIPLGGGRDGPARTAFNLMVVFVVSGLWHGASWNFIIWGALNGVYVMGERFWPWRAPVKTPPDYQDGQGTRYNVGLKSIKILATFGLVCFSWIFFRARSVKDGVYIYEHFSQGLWPLKSGDVFAPQLNYVYDLLPAVIGLTCILFFQLRNEVVATEKKTADSSELFWNTAPVWLRWAVYTVVALTIINFGAIKTMVFIYFQF